MSKMIYIADAAEMLGVSTSTIHRWRREKRITGMRKIPARNSAGYVWKIPVSALEGLQPQTIGKRSPNYGYGRNGIKLLVDK